MPIYQNSEKLETVAMETLKPWFADFEELFDPERLWYSHLINLDVKQNGLAIF